MATYMRCALASLDGLSLSSIIKHGVIWLHWRPFACFSMTGTYAEESNTRSRRLGIYPTEQILLAHPLLATFAYHACHCVSAATNVPTRATTRRQALDHFGPLGQHACPAMRVRSGHAHVILRVPSIVCYSRCFFNMKQSDQYDNTHVCGATAASHWPIRHCGVDQLSGSGYSKVGA
jgi:hypothetical protein